MIPFADLPVALQRYLADTGLSQKALADRLNVDQSTISRLISAAPKQSGPAVRALCEFMQEEGYEGSPTRAQNALVAVWDGSPEHDAGLSDLILASRSLRAERPEETDDD